jgi:tetratricopeptide (TPR) repeat protein
VLYQPDQPMDDNEQAFAAPDDQDQIKMAQVEQVLDDQAPGEVVDQPISALESDAAAEPSTPPFTERESRQFAALVNRMDELTSAIENHPDAPASYVLRGEIFLDGGDIDLAAQDFQKALELADPGAETANWGYVYRALADRAREGLRQCRQTN